MRRTVNGVENVPAGRDRREVRRLESLQSSYDVASVLHCDDLRERCRRGNPIPATVTDWKLSRSVSGVTVTCVAGQRAVRIELERDVRFEVVVGDRDGAELAGARRVGAVGRSERRRGEHAVHLHQRDEPAGARRPTALASRTGRPGWLGCTGRSPPGSSERTRRRRAQPSHPRRVRSTAPRAAWRAVAAARSGSNVSGAPACSA